MAPSVVDPSAQASELQISAPPPKLYTPRELQFEKYLASKSDGYQKARSLGPGRAAIVIDNGYNPFDRISLLAYANTINRLFNNPRWLVLRNRAPPKCHTHLLEISRPEGGQVVLLCRRRCIRRHHSERTYEECIRGRKWHCQ
jgi:hypothetical protein